MDQDHAWRCPEADTERCPSLSDTDGFSQTPHINRMVEHACAETLLPLWPGHTAFAGRKHRLFDFLLKRGHDRLLLTGHRRCGVATLIQPDQNLWNDSIVFLH